MIRIPTMPFLVRTLMAGRLRRLLAAGCTGLVLGLTIFAASPAAHGALHADGDGHHHTASNDACAVVLFASGVDLPMTAPYVTPPASTTAAASVLAATIVFLVPPRYLRQPERGPPVNRVS
jgi:hypothetical protein